MSGDKKNILILADSDNWCFANRAGALEHYAPDDLHIKCISYSQHSMNEVPFPKYDLVFVLPTLIVRPLRAILDQTLANIPMVASHNSGMGRRETMLLSTILAADYTIINNVGAYQNARLGIIPERFTACNISNGVDLKTFYPTRPIGDRPHKIVWTAGRIKIDGPEGDIKGYHDVLSPLKEIAEGNGFDVDYRIVDPECGMTPDQMREWYNTASYLVCASPAEGTPNIMLEAAACGCVPIVFPTGNAAELIESGRSGVLPARRDTAAFRDALYYARDNRQRLSDGALEAIQEWDWSIRAQWFYALFRKILAGQTPRAFSYLDTRPCEV